MYKKFKKHFRNQEKSFMTLCGKNDNIYPVHFAENLEDISCLQCISLLSNKTLLGYKNVKKEKTNE